MDIKKKYKNMFSLAFIVFCLLASACDDSFDQSGGEGNGKTVPLRFSVSVQNPAAAAPGVRSIPSGDNLKIITGTSFPVDTTFTFGMSVAGAGKMPHANSGVTYLRNSTGETFDFGTSAPPTGITGKNVDIIAYWPYNQNASVDSVPFDFTNPAAGQQEILWCSMLNQPVPDDGRFQLNFKHAFTRVKLNITKFMEKPHEIIYLTSAAIGNISGTWVKSKGKISAVTGWMVPSETDDASSIPSDKFGFVEKDTPFSLEFLVPSFMDTKVGNDNIAIILHITVYKNSVNNDGGNLFYFILDRALLNSDVDKEGNKLYGFNQGYTNTYNLEYDNSTVSLNVRNWNSVSPSGSFGLSDRHGSLFPVANSTFEDSHSVSLYRDRGTNYFLPQKYLGGGSKFEPGCYIDAHTYEDWLGSVSSGNNGDYMNLTDGMTDNPDKYAAFTTWCSVTEKPYHAIMVTAEDVHSDIAWQTSDGILAAKEACRNFHGQNYYNWRLPRLSEWCMMVGTMSIGGKTDFTNQMFESGSYYWSGTEHDENSAWVYQHNMNKVVDNVLDYGLVGRLSWMKKDTKIKLRCVRDVN